jgi:periplasmic divalent cation tolerance protein
MPDTPAPYIVVLCTAPTSDVSAELARGLVEAELAACVNIVPAVRSIYRWQGTTHDDAESLLVIKSRSARFDALAQWLRKHHPYSEPEIIALPIADGSPTYLAWIASLTGGALRE